MNKFFQPENPVIRFLSCFCDLMFTNALFIICSLPIFTIGASITSMYHVIFKLQDREDSYIYKMFFESFRSNFKQATTIWIPFLLLTGFFAGDLYIIYNVIICKILQCFKFFCKQKALFEWINYYFHLKKAVSSFIELNLLIYS